MAASVAGLALLQGGARDEALPSDSQRQEYAYVKASTAFHDGNYEEAIRLFETLRKERPNDARILVALGDSYLSVGRLKDAREAFERAVVLEPKRPQSWSRVGILRAQVGDLEGARAALQKALSGNSRDTDALEQLAELDAISGKIDEAVTGFTRAADAAPVKERPALVIRAASLLELNERIRDGVTLLRKARDRGLRDAELLAALGELELRDGQLEAAAATYREAAIAARNDASLWVILSELLLRLGKPDDAEQALRQSLQVEERALTHLALGRLALARGRLAEAEKALEDAAKALTGSSEREMVEVADLLIALGRNADALRVLASVAAEDDQRENLELQRRTAALAVTVGQRELAEIACVRVRAADGGTCP